MSSEGRRQTRASLASASNRDVETHKIATTHKPTINDLVLGNEPLSLENLLSSFPGRRLQIDEILRLLGPLNSPMLPLFIYGGPSTGKTSVILQIFKHLKRPFVYASCLTCYNPRILFESILNQLMLHQRNKENCYSSAKRCERPSDFVNFLREALINILDNLKGKSGKSGPKKLLEHVKGYMIYLIIDNMELVRLWDKSSTMLPFLFNLYDTLKVPEVGVIFISKVPPDSYYSNTGYVEPIAVYFPGYTEKDIRQIFMQNQTDPKLYSSFLDHVLGPFFRSTRRVDELSVAFCELFKKYCEPSGELEKEGAKRSLFNHLRPHILPALNEIFRISSSEVGPDDEKAKVNESSRKLGHHETTEEMDFHMPFSTKYLLLSAFIASRNPASHDDSLFDPTGGCDNRKRKRKCSVKTMELKEMAELESLMKGPGTFPLERLLAIFHCIVETAVEIPVDGEKQEHSFLGTEIGCNELMSAVLLQLSTLCNANFICKGGSCPLEGSTRYRCTISEELAFKIARSLKFPLSNLPASASVTFTSSRLALGEQEAVSEALPIFVVTLTQFGVPTIDYSLAVEFALGPSAGATTRTPHKDQWWSLQVEVVVVANKVEAVVTISEFVGAAQEAVVDVSIMGPPKMTVLESIVVFGSPKWTDMGPLVPEMGLLYWDELIYWWDEELANRDQALLETLQVSTRSRKDEIASLRQELSILREEKD
ncbi:hypothetical protein Nepgr_033150 [Nepenthes gracilis]|uniref:Origin recognition complex subunit 5 n=1 Tax=Nepenthes gracilis TaxID=150966 RepID=A0AAD3TM62_NEPGR|nr:hypothetical protein Nepgr_033150 [Nepenthes gracilis]